LINAAKGDGAGMTKVNSTCKRISAVPTAAGGIARAAYAHSVQSISNIKSLAGLAGLSLGQLEDSSLRIGVDHQIKFLNVLADALDDEFLGFHLASEVDLREAGLLYYVQASSETIGEALQRVQRYCTIQNEGVLIRYSTGEAAAISFEYRGVRRLNDRHQIEFFATYIARICRILSGRHVVPKEVRLAHRRTEVDMEMTKLFGCEIHFGAHTDEILYPASLTLLPVTSADMYLNKLLIQYCEEALSQSRILSKSWRISVENALAPLLPHGQATVSQVSMQLGVSERTLQRRLASEGTSFPEVLNNLRCMLAKRYLREPNLPVSEIAWLLGYSQPTAFTHAFRRWTGKSPKQARD
jgi:AraC-like DNA-binding protein